MYCMKQSFFGSHVEAVVQLDPRCKQRDALKFPWMTTIQARRRAGFESCTTIIIHVATQAQQDEKYRSDPVQAIQWR